MKFHGRFRRRRSSALQRRNTEYHVLYTTLTFQAGTTAILNWVLELFSIINPMLIFILKLYYFHTMDNRRQAFFRNHLVQRVRLPSPSHSRPTRLRSLLFQRTKHANRKNAYFGRVLARRWGYIGL